MLKFIVLAILFVAVFISSIGANVIAHEGAHYLVADGFELEPEIHFKPENISARALYSMDVELAYVEYSANSDAREDAMIAAAGPLVNLGICLAAMLFYFSPKRSNTGKLLIMVVLVTSFISFAVNMLPVSPSDGSYVWSYLF